MIIILSIGTRRYFWCRLFKSSILFGQTSQPDKKTNENGKLQLIFGSPNLFSKSTYLVKPEIGDFYLFPNYLMHTVYPFSGTDEERRSVSFNAKVLFF